MGCILASVYTDFLHDTQGVYGTTRAFNITDCDAWYVMSHVSCRMSHVSRLTSHVSCLMSHVRPSGTDAFYCHLLRWSVRLKPIRITVLERMRGLEQLGYSS